MCIRDRLQQLRNEFAVQKRRQEEERRRAAMIEQQKQASIAKYRTDLEEDYRRVFNGVLNGSLNKLMGINTGITLDNIQQSKETITNFTTTLDETPFSRSMVLLSTNVSSEEPVSYTHLHCFYLANPTIFEKSS